jgi:hypothetical protein
MRKRLRLIPLVVLSAALVAGTALTAKESGKPDQPTRGLEAAKALTKITGVAISPLLGVGAIGAYDYFTTPSERRDELPWYAHPAFWLPALLLVGAVAAKDALGTALPPGLKKPLDVAEAIENKISGVVMAGAFVPLIASIFHSAGATEASVGHGLNMAGFAAVDLAPLLNILTVPLAIAVFVVVWLVGHVVNVLILISPFGVVDAALKSLRTALLGALVIVHHIDPWAGAVMSLVIIIIAYFLAGWSFRLMIFGSVFAWDFVTRRRKRFKPAADANRMFTARKLDKMPVRTYGRLMRGEGGHITFEYRPWVMGHARTVTLPQGNYAVGRGLFYPEIMLVDGEKTRTMLLLPPRYKDHEQELAGLYGITDIRDTGLLRGIKAFWRWFTRNLFGAESKEAAATATAS